MLFEGGGVYLTNLVLLDFVYLRKASIQNDGCGIGLVVAKIKGNNFKLFQIFYMFSANCLERTRNLRINYI